MLRFVLCVIQCLPPICVQSDSSEAMADLLCAALAKSRYLESIKKITTQSWSGSSPFCVWGLSWESIPRYTSKWWFILPRFNSYKSLRVRSPSLPPNNTTTLSQSFEGIKKNSKCEIQVNTHITQTHAREHATAKKFDDAIITEWYDLIKSWCIAHLIFLERKKIIKI